MSSRGFCKFSRPDCPASRSKRQRFLATVSSRGCRSIVDFGIALAVQAILSIKLAGSCGCSPGKFQLSCPWMNWKSFALSGVSPRIPAPVILRLREVLAPRPSSVGISEYRRALVRWDALVSTSYAGTLLWECEVFGLSWYPIHSHTDHACQAFVITVTSLASLFEVGYLLAAGSKAFPLSSGPYVSF